MAGGGIERCRPDLRGNSAQSAELLKLSLALLGVSQLISLTEGFTEGLVDHGPGLGITRSPIARLPPDERRTVHNG